MPVYALDGHAPVLPAPGEFWVAPGAQLAGHVVIGRDASIWFNAVVRGDNETIRIGERTNIQDNAVLHSDWGFPLTLGADCTIGHKAILHGCTIGDGSLIGMGATVLNGAVIGKGSLVGANTLVTEGKSFPAHSLIVGSPARAIRSLDEAAVAKLIDAATSYVENWKRFTKGLVEIVEA
jgi:carbonic anhydrase/acetyltransferase-like protein (isoleucine patch superfamily)